MTNAIQLRERVGARRRPVETRRGPCEVVVFVPRPIAVAPAPAAPRTRAQLREEACDMLALMVKHPAKLATWLEEGERIYQER